MAPNFAGIKAHNTHRQTSDQQCKCVLSRSQVYVTICSLTCRFLSPFCRLQYGKGASWRLFLLTSEIRICRKGLTVHRHIGTQLGKQSEGTR